MKKIYILLTVVLFSLSAKSQAPTIQWQKSLGGTNPDWAESIVQTTDGGYAVAGYSESIDGDVTASFGGVYPADSWIVKLNSTGTIQWQKSLGGTDVDEAGAIIQTTDGGYVVAGLSYSNDCDVTGNHGGSDYWIVKLCSTGAIQWQKSLGGTEDDDAWSIIQTTDGGYAIAGYSYSNDGDVTGHHGTDNYTDYWIVKLSSTGTIHWQKSLGRKYDDWANSIIQTTDGGYAVTGQSTSTDGDVTGNHGGRDYWVVKLSNTGGIHWDKTLGGTDWDEASSIILTTDEGYVVGGYSESNDADIKGNHGGDDDWIVKLNSIGDVQWQESLGGSDNEKAGAIIQTTDGGYALAGYSESNDGDVTGNHSSRDYWIVKLGVTTGIDEMENNVDFSLYPNPANNTIVIKPTLGSQIGKQYAVKIYSAFGQEVLQLPRDSYLKSHQFTIDISSLSPGVYFISLFDGEEQGRGMFVKE